MYICATCVDELKVGEVVILEKDMALKELSIRPIGGVVSGYVTYAQPEGCVDYKTAYSSIKDKRVIGKIAIISGGIALIHSDTDAFNKTYYTSNRQDFYSKVVV